MRPLPLRSRNTRNVAPGSAEPVMRGVRLLVTPSLLRPVSSFKTTLKPVGGLTLVSMVMVKAVDNSLTLPAASTACAVMLYLPSASGMAVLA